MISKTFRDKTLCKMTYGLSPDMVAFQGFHPSLYPYFHVSVGGVKTTVASEHTDSADGTVTETTAAVVPEFTTEGAIEGFSRLTHGLLDKMTATSHKNIFHQWKFCFSTQISLKFGPIDSKSALVQVMAWRLFCKGNQLVDDEFPSHSASSGEIFGILLHRHILTRGKIAATSSQMINFSPSSMVLIRMFMSLRILLFYGFYIVHVA